jgi:hypothetical protein
VVALSQGKVSEGKLHCKTLVRHTALYHGDLGFQNLACPANLRPSESDFPQGRAQGLLCFPNLLRYRVGGVIK